jgi:uncharacterized membrane protein YqgA involved in biofilm formation
MEFGAENDLSTETLIGARGEAAGTNREVSGSILDGVIDIIFQSHYGLGVDSASSRNEY